MRAVAPDAREEAFKSSFAAIPFERYLAGKAARSESCYSSAVYADVAAPGFEVTLEDCGSGGRT